MWSKKFGLESRQGYGVRPNTVAAAQEGGAMGQAVDRGVVGILAVRRGLLGGDMASFLAPARVPERPYEVDAETQEAARRAGVGEVVIGRTVQEILGDDNGGASGSEGIRAFGESDSPRDPRFPGVLVGTAAETAA